MKPTPWLSLVMIARLLFGSGFADGNNALPKRLIDEEKEVWTIVNEGSKLYGWDKDNNLSGVYDESTGRILLGSGAYSVTPLISEAGHELEDMANDEGPFDLPVRVIDEKGEGWSIINPRRREYSWDKDPLLTGRLNIEKTALSVGGHPYSVNWSAEKLAEETWEGQGDGDNFTTITLPKNLIEEGGQVWSLAVPKKGVYKWDSDKNLEGRYSPSTGTIIVGSASFAVKPFLTQETIDDMIHRSGVEVSLLLPPYLIEQDGKRWILISSGKREYGWMGDTNLIGKYNPVDNILTLGSSHLNVEPAFPEK